MYTKQESGIRSQIDKFCDLSKQGEAEDKVKEHFSLRALEISEDWEITSKKEKTQKVLWVVMTSTKILRTNHEQSFFRASSLIYSYMYRTFTER